jgi:hypothetical protein
MISAQNMQISLAGQGSRSEFREFTRNAKILRVLSGMFPKTNGGGSEYGSEFGR